MPFNLQESFILAAEQSLGTALPESYSRAMLRSNGGELDVYDDDWMQYPIADASDRKRLSRTANHILKETEACRKWPNFPKDAIAIADNGSGDQLVFIKKNSVFGAEVYMWLHETGDVEKIADDFTELKTL